MLYSLDGEVLLTPPREEVFAFFSDARNLAHITPVWMQFDIVSGHDLTMRPGLRIDYRIKLHGVPMTWQSEISAWEPPCRFVDEQRAGPYRTWIHEHTFEEVEGGTLVRDCVSYQPKGGPLVHRWLVRPNLERIFAFRTEVLRDLFNT